MSVFKKSPSLAVFVWGCGGGERRHHRWLEPCTAAALRGGEAVGDAALTLSVRTRSLPCGGLRSPCPIFLFSFALSMSNSFRILLVLLFVVSVSVLPMWGRCQQPGMWRRSRYSELNE